jgi:hypothetical protein
LAVALAAATMLAACSGDDSSPDPAAADPARDTSEATSTTAPSPAALPDGWEGYESDVYSDPAVWICRGDTDDVCDRDLDATVVHADGSTEVEAFAPVADAPVDCFYLYPTISGDSTPNSDLVPQEEIGTVVVHAARYGEVCRVFAPVYRSTTLTALVSRLDGADAPATDTRAIAFADVVDSFKHYLANWNEGRGVVLMGHSQGSGLLLQLLREEIEGNEALRSRFVSALLLGTTVRVPPGEDVGADLAQIPLCRARDELGCVVTYASFRSTSPPPAGSFFGRADDDGNAAGCVNPAAPAGGRAPLTGYWRTAEEQWIAGTTISTPFVKVPGLVEGECVERDGFSYLEITVVADPDDPRIDDIRGDLTPEWGLHTVDPQLALGDLVELVRSQSAAYEAP